MNDKRVFLARLISPVWRILGLFFSKKRHGGAPKSVLIFDFHLIGDIVLLTPLLRAMRKGYPEARITLVAGPWADEILRGTGWVDEVVPFLAPWVRYGQGWPGWVRTASLIKRLRSQSWDLGIEIRGDVRQILLLAMAGARRRVGYDLTGGKELLTDVVEPPPAGSNHFARDYHLNICRYLGVWQREEFIPELRLTGAERAAAQATAEFTGIHFGASLPLKIPPVESMAAFLDKLIQVNALPLVVYRVKEAPEVSAFLSSRLRDQYNLEAEIWEGSLREFIVHLSRCKKLYCLDSGPAHIGAALGIDVTVIYGPTVAHVTRPFGERVTIVDGRDLQCRPCDQRHCVAKKHQECFVAGTDWA